MRGGEKVLEDICSIYPDADIYTHIYDQNKVSSFLNSFTIKTTFINSLPFSNKIHSIYLPLMPLALKFLNLKSYDLIISSEAGPSKGVHKHQAKHVCYCHSPMRYIWDMYSIYYKNSSIMNKIALRIFRKPLRKWDIKSSYNLDLIIANSSFVSIRIKNYWKKDSIIINPGIDMDLFSISDNKKNYYLIVSELVQYKKIDLAIDAFNLNKKELYIIGKGPMLDKYKQKANQNITFLGPVTNQIRNKYLSECKGLIFPGIEDFGIVPLEAMASGIPVLAFNFGGIKDYLINGVNGITFKNQTAESLNNCIKYFEKNINKFDPLEIRKSISKFTTDNFKNIFKTNINNILKNDKN